MDVVLSWPRVASASRTYPGLIFFVLSGQSNLRFESVGEIFRGVSGFELAGRGMGIFRLEIVDFGGLLKREDARISGM